jgi:allantoin racemase
MQSAHAIEGGTMRLLVVNPNTSSTMTQAIAQAAQAAASGGTRIVAVQPSFGPRSIEGHYDEAFAAAGVAEQVRLARSEAFDGVIVACFGDPGVDAAREACAAPVLGVAEAAFHAASFVATGFSVVTTLTRTCVIAERLLLRYGFDRHCRGVHGTDIPVLALDACGGETVAQIEACARDALQRDRSGAIVLGCAGMAGLARTLQQRLRVPVIDGVAAAVRIAEALAGLGLMTSKRGDYATPLDKEYAGWSAPLGWP